MESRISRMVSFTVLIAIIVVFGALFYRVMSIFFLPLFLAALLVVIFHPVHHWMLDKCKQRQRLAAGLTTTSILLIVLIPLAWILSLGVMEGAHLVAGLDDARPMYRIQELRQQLGLNRPYARLLDQIESRFQSLKQLAQDWSPSSGSSAVDHAESQLDELHAAIALLTEHAIFAYRDQRLREFVIQGQDAERILHELERQRADILAQTEAGSETVRKEALDKAQGQLQQLNIELSSLLEFYQDGLLTVLQQRSGRELGELNFLREQWDAIHTAADQETNDGPDSTSSQDARESGEMNEQPADKFDEFVLLNDDLETLWKAAELGGESLGTPRPLVHRMVRKSLPFTIRAREQFKPIATLRDRLELSVSPPSAEEFRRSINLAELDFQLFRQQMLGGAAMAWLIELVNPSEIELQNLQAATMNYFKDWILSVSGATTARIGGLLLGLAIMTVAMFYFLAEGPAMISAAMRLSPLDDRYERELFGQFDRVSRAVVLATLLSAVAQGLLAGVGFYVAGLPSLFLLTMLTMVLAMIPFVGAAAVWVPASLWLAFAENRILAGVLLAVYGALVVSMADNLIKPFVLHGQSKLHPLLALLSVLGGVQALGPVGILVGPMVVSFLQALLNMLHAEITAMDNHSAGSAVPD